MTHTKDIRPTRFEFGNRYLAFAALASFSITVIATAQFEISRHAIAGGGGTSEGGIFSLSGTIGQLDAQPPPVMSGGGFDLTGGFWPAAATCTCLGDVNHDGRRDGKDVQSFVNCLVGAGGCDCANVDQLGGADVNDINFFVSDILAGAACP